MHQETGFKPGKPRMIHAILAGRFLRPSPYSKVRAGAAGSGGRGGCKRKRSVCVYVRGWVWLAHTYTLLDQLSASEADTRTTATKS